MKIPTPIKSIRAYCIWCCGEQLEEVKLCPAVDCLFYPFRMGKKTIKGSIIKIIKKKCLDCGEGTPQKVKSCEFPECQVYPYREGKSPNHKGRGGNITNLVSFSKKATPPSKK